MYYGMDVWYGRGKRNVRIITDAVRGQNLSSALPYQTPKSGQVSFSRSTGYACYKFRSSLPPTGSAPEKRRFPRRYCLRAQGMVTMPLVP